MNAFIKFWLAIIGLFLLASPAMSQEIPDNKDFSLYSSGGIDIFTGQFKLFSKDISVGSGEFPSRLDLVRENSQLPRMGELAYSTHNLKLSANCSPCISGVGDNRLTIKAFDGTHAFKSTYVAWGTARTWTNMGLDGSQVIDNGSTLEFRSKSGDQIFFAATSDGGTGIGCSTSCRVPVYAVMASGESIVFEWETITTSGWPNSRLTKVTNSRGYGFLFEYMNPSPTTGNANQRDLVTKITAYRSGCVSGVVNCATGTLGSVAYGWTYVGVNAVGHELYRMTSFTNTEGRVLNYEYAAPGHRMTSAAYADKPTLKLFQNTYAPFTGNTDCDEGKVTEQLDALLRKTIYDMGYCYSTPRDRPTTIITDPDNTETTYKFTAAFNSTIIGTPTTILKPLSRTLTYTYDAGRLASAMSPAGLKVTYLLDDRGNALQTTTTANTGSTDPAIIKYASFPSCTATNFRYCNKPSYTIDERGAQTDYQYDAVHGSATAILLPADASNTRAVIRNTYASFYPAPGVNAPTGVTLVPAYFLTSTDTCLTSPVTGTTIDFTYVCPSGSRNRTSFQYTSSSASARTNHELEGVIKDADGAALRTCYRYDVVGNRIAETKPRAALSTCS